MTLTVTPQETPEALRSVSLDRAAELLGCKRSRLFELLNEDKPEKRLRSFKIGRERRVLLRDLEAFISARIEG